MHRLHAVVLVFVAYIAANNYYSSCAGGFMNFQSQGTCVSIYRPFWLRCGREADAEYWLAAGKSMMNF